MPELELADESINNNIILAGDLSWFHRTRADLLKGWIARARNPYEDGPRCLACKLADSARAPVGGHLSIPCSLAGDDIEIEEFLAGTIYKNEPVRFLRLFLFYLDQFAELVQEMYKRLDGTEPKRSDYVSSWTNKFAKHRIDFAIQHHPKYFFEDNDAAQARRAKLTQSGISVIKARNMVTEGFAANQSAHCVLMVPKLETFMKPVLDFYDAFVQYALARPDAVAKRFHSANHVEMDALLKILDA